MKYHLEWSIELQALERKLLAEIEDLEKQFFPNHVPTFSRVIEKKIAFLKEVLSTMEANQNIITRELAQLIDQKLEKEQRELKRAKNVFETDKIFDSVRILGWIKYLIIEKNGRVPSDSGVHHNWRSDSCHSDSHRNSNSESFLRSRSK